MLSFFVLQRSYLLIICDVEVSNSTELLGMLPDFGVYYLGFFCCFVLFSFVFFNVSILKIVFRSRQNTKSLFSGPVRALLKAND